MSEVRGASLTFVLESTASNLSWITKSISFCILVRGDVETDTEVFEIKSTTSRLPTWIESAWHQGELAATESDKKMGGIIKVWTGQRPARAFLIQEVKIDEKQPEN